MTLKGGRAGGVLVMLLVIVAGCEKAESVPAVFEGVASDEVVASNELATYRDSRTLHEVLAEYARGVPNYGYEPGSPAGTWAFYAVPFDVRAQLEADHLEYQTLLGSMSPGVRANAEGAVRERIDAWKAERRRAEAARERDEAEYRVFIRRHLRRLREGRAAN